MTAEEVADGMYELLFAVRKSRRYHMHFQFSYVRWNAVATFLTTISGFATVAAAFGRPDDWVVKALAASTALFAAFGFSLRPISRALQHKELGQDFAALEIEVRRAGEDTDEKTYHGLVARRLEIEMKEPPPVKSLNLLCHNEEVAAGPYDKAWKTPVSRFQRLLACAFGLRLDFLKS